MNAAEFAKAIGDKNQAVNPAGILHLNAADPHVINNCMLA